MWRHAIAHAGDRSIGLDGVPQQQANYEASGFVAAGGTTRFAGVIPPRESASIRRAEKSDLEDLIALEASATGVRKDAYLSAWFSDAPNRQTLVGEDGFCTIRKCREGAKIGPLHADHLETAEALIKHAAAQFGPQLTIDVPGQSKDLARLCRSLEMEPGFETARMYEGAKPLVVHSIFAVTPLELG